MFDFSRENKGFLASWWRGTDKTILFLILLMFFFGLFFSFSSTSYVLGEKLNKESYFFFLKHSAFVFLALTIIFFISSQKKRNGENIFALFFCNIAFIIIFGTFYWN